MGHDPAVVPANRWFWFPCCEELVLSTSARVLRLTTLLNFVEDRASAWRETHSESVRYGETLEFEKFNLYHANFWVIEPATQDHGCSYVELVATSEQDQRPRWFVSHAWLEPIVRFVLCLKRHAFLRRLTPENSAYWVCALAEES